MEKYFSLLNTSDWHVYI